MSALFVVPFVKSEVVLAVSLFLGTATMVGCMWTLLENIRFESRMEPAPSRTQYITQKTEDALPLETLAQLLDHPNYTVSDVAMKILTERGAFDNDVFMEIVRGCAKKDYDMRLKCLKTLHHLYQHCYSKSSAIFANPASHALIVRGLYHCTKEYDPENPPISYDPFWNEYPFRSEAERLALEYLYNVSFSSYDINVNTLLKCGFVEKWLVHQNWGTTQQERMLNFTRYAHSMHKNNKNNRVLDFIDALCKYPAGAQALERAGLYATARIESDPAITWGVKVYCRERDQSWDSAPGAATGIREHSAEEVRLRRQNRETVVVMEALGSEYESD